MVSMAVSRTTSPATDFYGDASVVEVDAVNNRTKIRFAISAVNRGTTDAKANYQGTQKLAWYGADRITRTTNPFLASGVGKGVQRWNVSQDLWVTHDDDGYFAGSDNKVTMSVYWSTHSYTAESAPLIINRINKVPKAPTGGTASEITQTSFKVSFTPGDNGGATVSSRRVEVSTSSSFPTGSTTVLTPAGLSNIAVTGRTARARYYVRAREVNSVGTGEWSATLTVDTVDSPDAPTVSVTSKSSTNIRLNVANPAYTGGAISARETQISLSSAFLTVLVTGTTATPNFTKAVHDIARATAYYVRSRVQNAAGWSPWSPVLSVVTDAELPSAPTDFSVTDLASTTAYLTMPAIADNGGEQPTNIRWRLNGGAVVTQGAYREPFLQGLTAGTTYSLELAVYNSAGWSAWSAPLSFTTKSNVPGPPTVYDPSVLGDNGVVLPWDPPAALNGATPISMMWRLSTSPSFSENLQILSSSYTANESSSGDLISGTTYYVQFWVSSSNGAGSFSAVKTFTTTGTPPSGGDAIWIRVGGAWKPAKLWIKVSGAWKQASVWVRVSGAWRKK